MLNPQAIRIFLTIVEHSSISNAAKALHFAQPTISSHLSSLEKELGVQLIIRERGVRRIRLTPAGESFVPLAQNLLNLNKQVEQFIQEQKQKGLRLAASASAHEYIIVDIMHKLIEKLPENKVHLLPIERREMRDAIDTNQFDIAFYFGPPPESPQIKIIPLFEEEKILLCPASTNLPDRDIHCDELDPTFEIFNISYPRNKYTDEWHAQHFPDSSEPLFRVDSLTAAHNYLIDPRTWAVLPISLAQFQMSKSKKNLVIRHIAEKPPARICNLLVSKLYRDSEVIQALLQSCSDYVDERNTFLKKLFSPEHFQN